MRLVSLKKIRIEITQKALIYSKIEKNMKIKKRS